MTTFRPKLWTAVGAAALLTAAACARTGEEGERAPAASAESAVPVGEAGETAGGEGGAGEAGAADAYASVPAASRTALRIAHLRGFFLIAQEAQKTQGDDEAAALAGQGMLEVFDPAAAVFREAGLDEARLRDAAAKGDAASLQAAVAMLDSARRKVGGDPAAVINGMTSIAAGLYGNVVVEGTVDPTEYQHSRGAALSARSELQHFGADNAKAQAVKADLDRFIALWPAPVAPEDAAKVTPAGQVQAQASRIQLALS
jgi:hypothetical protein